MNYNIKNNKTYYIVLFCKLLYIYIYLIYTYVYIYSNNRKHNLAGWTGTLDVSLGSGISGLSPCTGTGGTKAAAEIGSRQGCVAMEMP